MNSIKQARSAAGYSQAKLGLMVGVTKQSVSAWELGDTVPSPEVAKRLTEVLPGLTLEQIYTTTATSEAA